MYAPGVDLVATGLNDGYKTQRGTSFAAPLVAGVAALVKTRFPNLSPDALREHIRLTSENMDEDNPLLAGQLGRGLVNALAAGQAPELPAVRVRRWSWSDDDGNRRMDPGNVVKISATLINYLANSRQLSAKILDVSDSSIVEMMQSEVMVGQLISGDSANVAFTFRVADDAPEYFRVRFVLQIEDGAFVDEPEMFLLGLQRPFERDFEALRALYRALDGDN